MNKTQYQNKILASGKQTRIIKRFFFFKLGIKVNYNSKHELASLFQLLLYMFVNQLSAEEASSQLKIEFNDFLVASADTLLRRLKQSNKKMLCKAFNSTLKRICKCKKQSCIMAIDYHDIMYYGNKNNPEVRGTKRKAGTNYCHQYATLEIVEGENRLTLAVRKLSVNDDSKAKVVRELIQIAKKHAKITFILLDRAFYGFECIRNLKLLKVKFVMAVPKDKAIKKQIKEHSIKIPKVVDHSVGKKEKESFKLCMIYGKTKEENKPLPVYCFATNIQTENAQYIAELYKKRWSIETGYKTKKQFRAKTSTQNNLVREIYFFMECLLYNAWYNTKAVTSTTIASFKKIIEKIAIKNLLNYNRTET